MSRVPEGPPPAPVVQRVRVHYAKRGRLRFTSHRDFQRAFERAVRRAVVPIAFSAGFTPHPKISYAGAAPTGVASEAEYLEVGLAAECDPERLRDALDTALPPGLDVLEVVVAGQGALADRLEASLWRAELPHADGDVVDRAVAAFLAADEVAVERLTKQGMRRFDARVPVLSLCRRPAVEASCAIIEMVVRHVTPAVRPDDVLTGMRRMADDESSLADARVTRIAQGPLGADGRIADPLAADRMAGPAVVGASLEG